MWFHGISWGLASKTGDFMGFHGVYLQKNMIYCDFKWFSHQQWWFSGLLKHQKQASQTYGDLYNVISWGLMGPITLWQFCQQRRYAHGNVNK